MIRSAWTNPFVEVVASELHSRVGHDSDAVCTVAPHEPPPALFLPHLLECLPDTELILIAACALDLEQDLQALEWRNDRPRDSAGHTTSTEGRSEWLRNNLSSLSETDWRGRRNWWVRTENLAL